MRSTWAPNQKEVIVHMADSSANLRAANANHLRGTLLTVLGMIILSPDSLLVKILSKQVPVFTLIFFKYSIVLATWIFGFTSLHCFYPEEKSV